MRHPLHFAVFVVLVGAAGCGGSSTAPANNNSNPPGGGGSSPPSTSTSVTVKNNYFDPGATTVPRSSTVTWTWDSCSSDGYGGMSCASHSIVFDDGPSSGQPTDNGTYSRTFSAAGTYKYHCAVHGTGMSGQVVVQ